MQAIAVEGTALAGDRAADAQRTAPRVADAVRNVLAWSDALAAVARRCVRRRTWRDADGDGRVTFATGEPGLQLLQVSVRTRAGTPPPRAGTASPAPSTAVGR